MIKKLFASQHFFSYKAKNLTEHIDPDYQPFRVIRLRSQEGGIWGANTSRYKILQFAKGSFTYDVHDLGFFEFKIGDKRGRGGLKIPFFDGLHK